MKHFSVQLTSKVSIFTEDQCLFVLQGQENISSGAEMPSTGVIWYSGRAGRRQAVHTDMDFSAQKKPNGAVPSQPASRDLKGLAATADAVAKGVAACCTGSACV